MDAMHTADNSEGEFATGRIHGAAGGPLVLRVAAAGYGARGVGAQIGYAVAPSPCGQILVAATTRGVTWIGIHDSARYLETELRGDFGRAEVGHDAALAPLADRVVAAMFGEAAEVDLPLDIRATPFQLRVWRELCAIPRGATRTYGMLARAIAQPTASRAVGLANGSNPLAIVIPCHRVIGTSGALTGYRWGLEYKRRLLDYEQLESGPRV